MVFCIAKGHLLSCKRASFARQNMLFCKTLKNLMQFFRYFITKLIQSGSILSAKTGIIVRVLITHKTKVSRAITFYQN